MAKKRKWTARDIPPCPDPAAYVLVKAAEGPYWRRKRGSVKPAVLNPVMAANQAHTAVTNAAASRVLSRLRPWLQGLTLGRTPARIAGAFKKALNRDGVLHYDGLKELEWQPDYPLDYLLPSAPQVHLAAGALCLTLDLRVPFLKRQSPLVTHWWAELVILWGDPGSDDLRVDSAESPLFAYEATQADPLRLAVPLPEGKAPWMGLLKVNSLEGNELAVNSRHYGMKVVRTGNGKM